MENLLMENVECLSLCSINLLSKEHKYAMLGNEERKCIENKKF